MSNPWYGVVKGVDFVSNSPVSDPALVYKGHEFNYWDIEDAMYDQFKEWLLSEYPDDEYLVSIGHELGTGSYDFRDWLANNVEHLKGYLDDCIVGGYFGSEVA